MLTLTSEVDGQMAESAVLRPRRGWLHRDTKGWIFVGPFLAVFALTFLAPIGYAIYLSLFREQAFFGGNTFVGLDNYAEVVRDSKFWEAFLRVLLFLVVQVPVMLVLALLAALAIDSARLHASSFFRIVIFLPYAVPGVVAVLMWGYIYGNNFGLAADLNDLLGSTAIQPLSKSWMLPSIANIVTWEFVGYNMLIFYSALRTVPEELYEAAAIDGAGTVRTILAVKLPALRGAIVIATIFSIIGSFQLFNEPNILRTLAPNVITTYFTPNMYAYNLSFAGQQFNYSATVAIVMGVITAVIAYVVQLRGSREAL
ncbi:multiple sugar transport system permease protein [Kribbella orskensis]|uniref:Multiple sugar transport system permease protein n=1 Tax=Kribbella orskensis TaxID=2512216 RepID=A0ABY2BFY4_9ACTN|nr:MULTISPECIES: sugar ABC transporter permease [Kribbella]TCM35312.1 multiple sugar transport system permease protein [Kribbella sp. VKM Ac-2568]TCN35549.1 multiple sugar transport system permease protein [Kribbella sp. VKM Ac-2500]TCO17091.1 multiple sugar transport system permease protein [Kribbella orskensis]